MIKINTEKITDLLCEKNYRLKDLVTLSGISRTTLWRILSKGSTRSIAQVNAIACALGVDSSVIICE